MAETCVANFMEVFLGKARSLIAGESTSLAGVLVARIKDLIAEVEKAVSVVSEAECSGLRSGAVRDWVEKVNAAISEADYLLDECAYENHRLNVKLQGKKSNKVRKFFSLLNICSKMSQKIRAIRRSLEKFLQEASGFDLVPTSDNVVMTKNVFSSRQSIDFSVIESLLVRENNDVPMIIDAVVRGNDSDEDLSFVSFVGWGGVGKTTLARIVYKDVSVMYHFNDRIWVQVSEDFSIDRILKDMLASLTGTSFGGFSADTCRDAIMRRLQERLKEKRYLLVLDDVCDEDITLWDSLMNCLFKLGGSRGSKVVLTTCAEEVADLVRSSFVYKLRLESDDYCWTLFEQIAFAEGGATKTTTMLDLARSMVRECRGNPMYIKLMGSLMYYMEDESKWLSIKKSERWQDLCNAIPTLCYDFLPSMWLKKCFIYCSIFPKDSVIDREELIQLWMVQGFLNPPKEGYLKMEDVGAKYYDVLLQKFFLQVSEDDEVDRTSCKMNDLLRCFALSTSKDYYTVLENMDVMNDFEAVHLSIINCRVAFSSLRDVFSKLRTLRLENIAYPGYLQDVLMFTKDLRVFIVVDQKADELPSCIGKLKHLRYLDISKTGIVKLPDSIVELYNLHTLRLHDLEELPTNFENLVKLRYFFVETFKDSAKTNILPPRIRALLNPLSYKAFLDNECRIENLKLQEHPERFSSLRIFRLENVSNSEEATKAKLSKMTGIESLKFHWNARRENYHDEVVLQGLEPHSNIKTLSIENFKGSTFPSWMVEPESLVLHNLVKVELENCCWCEKLPPLGILPHLKIVKIIGMDSVKSIGKEFFGFTDLDGESSSSGGTSAASDVFPMLKEFILQGMASLEDWSGAEHLSTLSLRVFPFLEKFEVEQCPKLISLSDVILDSSCKHLQRLEIVLCDNLNHLPNGIERLESLEDLEIRGLPSLPRLTIGSVKNLRSLTIGSFSSASSEDNSSLHLEKGLAELKSLPEQIQYLSALMNLTIWGYGAIEALPQWLANLKSLQILKLEFCWKLMYLPPAEKMKELKSLEQFHICYWPLLEYRCTKGSRPEWNKVSHIPTITINYENIKSQM